MTSPKRYHDDLPDADLAALLDEARRGTFARAAWRHLKAPSLAWDVAHDEGRHDWLALASPEAGWHVLDLGTAYGGLALALRRRGCQVVPLDVSPSRLALLRCRDETGESEAPFRPTLGDALALPFRDEAFDAMTCMGVLEWLAVGWCLDEPVEAVQRRGLREMQRCLRPKGRLWVAYENPEGARYRAGAPEDHTSLPELMTATRDEADRLCRNYTNQPFRAWCRNWNESLALFRSEGFHLRRAWLPFPTYKSPRFFLPVEDEILPRARRLGAELRWDEDLSPFDRAAAAELAEVGTLDALRRAAGAFLFEWEIS